MSADPHEPAALEIRLLGPVAARRGGAVLDLQGAKPRATLALLGLRVGDWVATEELIEGIWDGGAPIQARHALHVFISELRRRLGRETIATTAGGYRLALSPSCVDATAFDELVRRAAGAPPAGRVQLLREALGLWRGPPPPEPPPAPGPTPRAAQLRGRRGGGPPRRPPTGVRPRPPPPPRRG